MTPEHVATLITPRLRLRDFRETDRAALRIFQMDLDTMRTFGGGIALTEEEADRVLQYHIECRNYPYWAWAVTLPADDHCFGQVTAGWSDYKGEKWVELAWILHKSMWGHGYGPEAVSAMIQHGMKELGWTRVMASAWEKNRRSNRLMEKIGMRYVGDKTSRHPGELARIFEMP